MDISVKRFSLRLDNLSLVLLRLNNSLYEVIWLICSVSSWDLCLRSVRITAIAMIDTVIKQIIKIKINCILEKELQLVMLISYNKISVLRNNTSVKNYQSIVYVIFIVYSIISVQSFFLSRKFWKELLYLRTKLRKNYDTTLTIVVINGSNMLY